MLPLLLTQLLYIQEGEGREKERQKQKLGGGREREREAETEKETEYLYYINPYFTFQIMILCSVIPKPLAFPPAPHSPTQYLKHSI
jgi:hypothetical protein